MPDAPTVSLDYGIKTLQFSWNAVPGATYYKLFENPDGVSGYSIVVDNITATSVNHEIALYNRINARYIVEACNGTGCTDSPEILMTNHLVGAIGYFKASNTEASDLFGSLVSISSDGTTMAVAAIEEASSATGVDGDQSDNTASRSGAVYVFNHSGDTWLQQAYLKASNTELGDGFGSSVRLSSDGNTLAVGAAAESSSGTGVNGDQTDNNSLQSGAVYVFTRSSAIWSQQAYIKASNAGAFDAFGVSVDLSSDGNTLAVGAKNENSGATGLNGDQSDNSEAFSGAVYVFTRTGSTWAQQAYLKASNTESMDWFGYSVSLSSDGNSLAVGAPNESSGATGVDGNQSDNSAEMSGAVYVFTRSGTTWSQLAYLKASNTGAYDFFGAFVSLSSDGTTLAVGAFCEGSSATGVDGDEIDNSLGCSGAVYVFSRNGTTWSQQAYLKASNTGSNYCFGSSVSLSSDGNTLAVGAAGENSGATGVNGNQADDGTLLSGAVYVFSRSDTVWSQQAYLKSSNTEEDDLFGYSVSLSSDSNTLAVGSTHEGSRATGIDGDQGDNSATQSGAVYLY